MRRRFLLGLAAIPFARPALAADRLAPLWPDEAGLQTVDHIALDQLLARYVRQDRAGIDRVDYAGFKASAGDRAVLADYLVRLQRTRPHELTPAEQLAFWANLYNAVTLRTVIDGYPLRSIRDLRPSLFAIGPWKMPTVRVAGVALSLDDIENGVVRPGFKDPRVHYMLNCASLGCPNLGHRAWRGASLEADLALAARAYVNHPRGARFVQAVGADSRRLVVSSLYHWYRSDFGGSDMAVIEHLKRFAAPALKARLAGVRTIAGDDYDWSLNDQKGAA
jgi:hypothetical protein